MKPPPRWRTIGSWALALTACATADDRPANQPDRPIAEGHGRLCVVGPITELARQVSFGDVGIERVPVTGARTCSDVAPGLVLIVAFPRDAAQRTLLEGWVDVGQTTTVELADPPFYAASAPETEALATIVGAGRCLLPRPGCAPDELADELTRLQTARRADAVRIRQAARLLLWKLPPSSADSPQQTELALEIWRELER